MKKLKWIVAVTLGIMSATAFAQTDAIPAEHAKSEHPHNVRVGKWQETLKDFEAQLQLNPQQVSQWQALHDARKAEMKVLKQNTVLTKEDKKAHAKSMRQHHHAELQKILSTEQYAQFIAIRKQKIQERRAHRHQRKNQKSGK